MLSAKSSNIHTWKIETRKRNYQHIIYDLSDLHWDNPKCQRDVLKKHLDQALEENARVILNGDTFCLMQGKYDRRADKKSLRPEHQVNNYIDEVINTAVEWFKPYAEIIDVVGYGNHETAIRSRLETDVVQRFVDLLNHVAKPKNKIYAGGYGGWYITQIGHSAHKIKYFHGSGGGGIVTRGEINLTRLMSMVEGADCITIGHVHENKETFISKECLDAQNNFILRDIMLLITGTYKEEYNEHKSGWHVERGAPPKVIGGRKIILDYHRPDKGKEKITQRSIRL